MVLSMRVSTLCLSAIFFRARDRYVEIGVRGRLGEDEPGVFPDGPLQCVVITEGHDGAVDAEPLEVDVAELQGLFVAVVGNDDMIAGFHQGKDGGGDGHHAR